MLWFAHIYMNALLALTFLFFLRPLSHTRPSHAIAAPQRSAKAYPIEQLVI